jgi:3-oxoacyl-[acyl-carrier protein] reductase
MPEQPVILITGASKGIGRAIFEHYLAAGWNVIGCSRSEIDQRAKNQHHYSVDITDEVAVREMFSLIRKEFGRLDVLVNNAGIAAMNHSLLMPLSTARNVMDTNFTGTFLLSREATKLMQKRKFGRIINFSTVAVPFHLEGEAVYAASKAAVEELTRILAREFADLGITVNAIGPTPINTDLIRGVPQEKIQALINRQAIKRPGKFEDIFNLIDFLVKPESDFITGQVIYLGGVS